MNSKKHEKMKLITKKKNIILFDLNIKKYDTTQERNIFLSTINNSSTF